MDECKKCPYCGQNFTEIAEFWDHINSLNCNFEPLPAPAAVNDTPSPPPRSSKSAISQPKKNTECSNYVPERVSTPVPSNEFHNGYGRSFDMDAMRINLPSSSQSPPSGNELTKPVTNGSLNKSLFSNMEFPSLAAEASSAFSQAPKWKCILCNVEFTQKQAMMAHIRSAGHGARASVNATSAGDRSQSRVQPKPTVPVTSTNDANVTNIANTCSKDRLVFMIRQIVREELQSMFQLYFDYSKKPEPSSSLPSSNIQTKNYDTDFIQIKGQSIRCEACNCSVSSLTNLSHHVEGKRHRAAVARLTAPTTFY